MTNVWVLRYSYSTWQVRGGNTIATELNFISWSGCWIQDVYWLLRNPHHQRRCSNRRYLFEIWTYSGSNQDIQQTTARTVALVTKTADETKVYEQCIVWLIKCDCGDVYILTFILWFVSHHIFLCLLQLVLFYACDWGGMDWPSYMVFSGLLMLLASLSAANLKAQAMRAAEQEGKAWTVFRYVVAGRQANKQCSPPSHILHTNEPILWYILSHFWFVGQYPSQIMCIGPRFLYPVIDTLKIFVRWMFSGAQEESYLFPNGPCAWYYWSNSVII